MLLGVRLFTLQGNMCARHMCGLIGFSMSTKTALIEATQLLGL